MYHYFFIVSSGTLIIDQRGPMNRQSIRTSNRNVEGRSTPTKKHSDFFPSIPEETPKNESRLFIQRG